MNKMLSKILVELRHGMRRAMRISHGRPYALPAERGASADAASLRRDAERIVRDLNEQFRK